LLDRLGVYGLERYQFHAVPRYDELETTLGEGDDPGALAAFEDRRQAGLIEHVGLTSHGDPSLVRTAMERIDALETVVFPTNYTLAAKDGPEHDYAAVLDLAGELGLGALGIEAFAKAPWPEDLPYETWYEPYDAPEEMEACPRFALSRGLTSIINAGDPRLVPSILDAAEVFEPMDEAEQAALVERTRDADTPRPTPVERTGAGRGSGKGYGPARVRSPMSEPSTMGFDRAERRRIYEYVEREGAAEPEEVRQNVLVKAESSSKPARSGGALSRSVPMDRETFRHHVSILKRDGYLEESNGILRVAFPMGVDAETVDLDGVEAEVRPARQEDITGIIGVVEAVAGETDHAVAARLAEQVSRDDVLLRHNETESRVFFVATVDGDAVGWLHVEALVHPRMEHTAELTVGVLEEYRDGGLGAALMDRGLDWARERGYLKVYQSLPATNERAVDFLEENGWTEEYRRGGHYLLDGEFVDEVGLAVWLDDRTV
jgi:GNAT superfamily N-acetyltransferase